MRRWFIAALLVVLALCGSATAARSSGGGATVNSFSIQSRFRIDFTGTNTVDWKLTPGSTCDAQGSGSQLIQLTSSGSAADRTFRLGLSISRGKVANVTVSLPIAGTVFRTAQRDDREGLITDPAKVDCNGLAGDDIGGANSLCGIATSKGLEGLALVAHVANNAYVVRNGGLELGFSLDPLGDLSGVGDAYYNDPNGIKPDCPLAGDFYLNYFANGQAFQAGGSESFLLSKHGAASDGGSPVPSYAPFSLKRLENCRVKTIIAQASVQDTSSGPFSWNTNGAPPPDTWAFWQSTTTLQWKMTLHRLGGCVRKAG